MGLSEEKANIMWISIVHSLPAAYGYVVYRRAVKLSPRRRLEIDIAGKEKDVLISGL